MCFDGPSGAPWVTCGLLSCPALAPGKLRDPVAVHMQVKISTFPWPRWDLAPIEKIIIPTSMATSSDQRHCSWLVGKSRVAQFPPPSISTVLLVSFHRQLQLQWWPWDLGDVWWSKSAAEEMAQRRENMEGGEETIRRWWSSGCDPFLFNRSFLILSFRVPTRGRFVFTSLPVVTLVNSSPIFFYWDRSS